MISGNDPVVNSEAGVRGCLKGGTGILPVRSCGIGILPMIRGLEAHATATQPLKHSLRMDKVRPAFGGGFGSG